MRPTTVAHLRRQKQTSQSFILHLFLSCVSVYVLTSITPHSQFVPCGLLGICDSFHEVFLLHLSLTCCTIPLPRPFTFSTSLPYRYSPIAIPFPLQFSTYYTHTPLVTLLIHHYSFFFLFFSLSPALTSLLHRRLFSFFLIEKKCFLFLFHFA